MRRARFRAFKCRQGIHRWFTPFDRMWQDLRVCEDCRKTVTAVHARFRLEPMVASSWP